MLNKNTKLFLLFSLVLITLVGITTVSAVAVDNNATTTLEDATSNTDVSQANINTLNDNNKKVYKSDVQDTSTVKDTDKAKSVPNKTVEQTNTKQVKGEGEEVETTVTYNQDPTQIIAGSDLEITVTIPENLEISDSMATLIPPEDSDLEDIDLEFDDIEGNVAKITVTIPNVPGIYNLQGEVTTTDDDEGQFDETLTVVRDATPSDDPRVTLTINPVKDTYLPGDEVTVTATITPEVDAIDTTFYIEDENGYYEELAGTISYNDNTASITSTLPSTEGTYTISVDTNDGLEDSLQVTVQEEQVEDEKQSTNLFVDADDTNLDNDLIISGRLSDDNDEGIVGATVKIIVTYDDTEVSFTTVTEEDGQFNVARRPLHSGDVTITAVYDGDDTYIETEGYATATITEDITVYTPVIDWEQDDEYIVTDDIIVSGDVYYLDDNGRVPIDNLKIYVTITYSDDTTIEMDPVKSDEGTFKVVIPASENILGSAKITITTDANNAIYESVTEEYDTQIVEELEYQSQIYLETDDDLVIVKDFTITGYITYTDENDEEVELPNQDITLKVIYDDDILNPTIQEFPVTTDEDGEFTQTVTPAMPGHIAIVAIYDKNESYAATNKTITTEITRVTPKVTWEELDDTYDITDDIEVGAYISYDGEAITTENITVPTVTIVYSDGSTKQANDVTLDDDGFLHATFEAPHNIDGAFDVYISIEATDIIEDTISYYDGESEITIKDTPTITVDLLDNYVYQDDILISGYVLDSEDNPIEGVEVTLTIIFNDDTENAITVTLDESTDEDGYYEYTIEGVDHTGKMTVYATTTETDEYYPAEETAETNILKETFLNVDIDSTTVVEKYLIQGSLMYTDETAANVPLGGKVIQVTVSYDDTGDEQVYTVTTDESGSYSISELPLTSGDITVTATFTDENVEYADYVDTADGEITKADLNILGETDEEWYTDEDLIVTAWMTYDVNGEEYEIIEDDASYYTITMTIEGDNKLYVAEDVVIENGLLSATFKAPFTTGIGTIIITREETDSFYEASNRDEINVEFIQKSIATVTIDADDTYYADNIEVTGTLFNTTESDQIPIEDAIITIDVILNDEVIYTVNTTTDEEGKYSIDIPTSEDMIGEEITLVAKFEDEDYIGDDDSITINVLSKETSLSVDVESVSIIDPVTITGVLFAEDATGETYLADQIITLTITYNNDEDTTETIKTLTDENGEYQITITPKTTGTIKVVATYVGTEYYPLAFNEAEGTISKVDVFIDFESDDNYYDEDSIIITAPIYYLDADDNEVPLTNDNITDITVTITYEDGTQASSEDVSIEDGEITATITPIHPTGDATITITTQATDKFEEKTVSDTTNILFKPVAEITIEADDTYYADDIKVTGTLFDITDEENPIAIADATVTLEVYLNDELINTAEATVDENGDYTINIPTTEDMIDEEITLVAKFEDEDHSYVQDDVTINVLGKETFITVEVDSGRIVDNITISGVLQGVDATGDIELIDQIITLTITYNNDEDTTQTIKTLTDENGEYQITITPKTTGTINIIATYAGAEDYPSATNEAEATITKADVIIDFETEEWAYSDEDITITAPIYYLDAEENEVPLTNNNITDITVTITYNDGTIVTITDATIEDGEITATIPATHPTGEATITITTTETDKFTQATTSANIDIITKREATITIEAEDTYYADDIVVTGTLFDTTEEENPVAIADATVTIDIIIDDEIVNTIETTTDVNGAYTINITTTQEIIGEEITLIAKYNDTDYTYTEDEANIEILGKETRILVSVDSGRIIDPVTISGYLSAEDASGDVDLVDQIVKLTVIYNDDEETIETYKVVTDDEGYFEKVLKPSQIGTIRVIAEYEGTTDYPAVSDEDEGNINKVEVFIEFEYDDTLYIYEDLAVNGIIYYLDADGNEVIITSNNITEGTVALKYDLEPYAESVPAIINYGEISGNITGPHVLAGHATIIISTEENDIFLAANATQEVNVIDRTEAEITVEAENTIYPDAIPISGKLTLPDDSMYPVEVIIEALYGDDLMRYSTFTDDNGEYTFDFPTSDDMIGEVTIRVWYEDADYTAANNTTIVLSQRSDATISFNFDKVEYNETDNIVINGTVKDSLEEGIEGLTINITIQYDYDDPITVEEDITTDSEGKFTYTFTAEKAGIVTVTTTSLQSDEYEESEPYSDSVNVKELPKQTVIAIHVYNQENYGQAIYITNGSKEYFIDDISIAVNGNVTANNEFLPDFVNTVNVTYTIDYLNETLEDLVINYTEDLISWGDGTNFNSLHTLEDNANVSVQVFYYGMEDVYLPSSSEIITFEVIKEEMNLELLINDTEIELGESVNITARHISSITGEIEPGFIEIIIKNSEGEQVGAVSSYSGIVTYIFTPDTLDIYDVQADNDTDERTGQISVGGKYNRKSTIELIDVESIYYQNRTSSISGVLSYGDEGTPIRNQNITITFTYEDESTENYTVITDSRGMFTVSINPQGLGEAIVTASFVGNETDTEIFSEATSVEYPTTVVEVEYELDITEIDGEPIADAETEFDLGSEVVISGIVDSNYKPLDVSEVTVIINGDADKAETIPLDDEGKFEYTFDGKDAGEYLITVKLDDETLDSVTIVIDNEMVEVNAELDDNEIYFGEEATVHGQLLIAGTTTSVANEEIIIKVNGVEKTRVTTDENGLFNYSFTPDATGEYTIDLIHEATNNYDENTTQLTLNVLEKVDTKLTIDTQEATALTPVNITGKLTDKEGNAIADENVTVTINGVDYIVTTGADGNYTVEYTPVNTDVISVSVEYAGNEKYLPSINTITITVNAKEIVMTVTPESITGKVDDEITVNVSFNDENINSGVVTLTDDEGNVLAVMDVEDGKANTTIVFDKAYEGNIIASYRGDKNYDVADVTVPAVIDTLTATITIDQIDDAKVGDEVTVTGKIVDENDNPVAFTPITVNDEVVITDEAGNFEAVVIPTEEGTNTVTVTLPDSGRYTEATEDATFTASKKDATISVDVPEDAEVGKETTVNGTVTDSEGTPLSGVETTVTINGEPTTVTTDANGKFSVPFTPTTAGPQEVKVAINDDTYKADPVEDSFTVTKQTATITPNEIKDPEVGKETTISGKVTDEKGNPVEGVPVTVTVNGEPTTVTTDADGKYEVPFTPTNTDENNVKVTINDDTYKADPVEDSFTADKQTATITPNEIKDPEVGKETTISGKVTDEEGNPVEGVPVTVTINGEPTTVTTDENGTYTVPFTPTEAGPQEVTVTIDDDTYKADPVDDSFTADKQTATIKVDDVDSEIDVPTNITGTVTDSEGNPVADTPVTVTIDGKPTTVNTDKDGKFNVPYTPTEAGEHELEVSIDDDTYEADPVEDTFDTAKHDATITVDSVKDPKLGLETEVTGTLTDSEGKPIANTPVTVTVNGKATNVTTDKDGKYSLPITPTSVGTNNVSVALPENDKYEADPVSTTFDAEKQDYKVSIDPVNNPVAGKPTDITGTVTDEEGNPVAGVPVTVNVNGKARTVPTDKDGKFNVSATPTEGTNTITASIPETANSYGQIVNQTITITKVPTKLALNVNNSVKVGDLINITGSLKDNTNKVLTGATVTVNVDGTTYTLTTDNKGNFNKSVRVTEVGKTSVTASYAGNATYEAANAITKVVKVNKLSTTTTVLNVANKTRTNITVTANVKDENNKNVNGGVVIFTDSNKTQLGTANVTSGKASVVVSYNTTFTGKVTASYTGSDNYTASTGSNNITITKLKTSLTIDPISGKVFDVIPVTVHVVDENGNPVVSGKVIFKVNGLTSKDENGETVRAVVVNGTATANITTTKTWLNITSFVAKYIGDDTYEECNNTTDDINITKRVANIELASDRTVARGGDQIVLTAIVTDEGKAVNGGVVIFKINGETIKDASGNSIKVEVVNGTAKLTYDIPLGMSAKNLTILAVYSNEIYNRAENTSALSIIRMDVYFNTSIVRTSTSTAHVSATLRDAYGNLITGTTTVAIKCNGKTLAKVDAKGGIVNTDISVKGFSVGTHTLEYVAGLNNRYNSVRMTNALVIEKAT